jgi:hypothetical protein
MLNRLRVLRGHQDGGEKVAQPIEQALSEYESDEDASPRTLLPACRRLRGAILPAAILKEQARPAMRTLQTLFIGGSALRTNHRHGSITRSTQRYLPPLRFVSFSPMRLVRGGVAQV